MDKKIVKIIIPIVMVVIILGIWIYKNQESNEIYADDYENLGNYNTVNNEVVGDEKNAENTQNEEFDASKLRLHVRSINDQELTEYELPIIIDFGANECIPCKKMAPVLESIYEEMKGKAIIQFVDTWKYPIAAREFPIQIIPTQLFINADGTAYIPSDEIKEELQFNIQYDYNTKEALNTLHIGALTEEQMKMILVDMGVEI